MAGEAWVCDVCGKLLIEHYPALELGCGVSLVRRLERAETRVAALESELQEAVDARRCVECGAAGDLVMQSDRLWYCDDAEACRERRVRRKIEPRAAREAAAVVA